MNKVPAEGYITPTLHNSGDDSVEWVNVSKDEKQNPLSSAAVET